MLCQTRPNISTVCWLQNQDLQIVGGGGMEFMREIEALYVTKYFGMPVLDLLCVVFGMLL